MGAKTVVGSGPYSNVKDVHTLREKLSGKNFPFVLVQEVSCVTEDHHLSAVMFLFANRVLKCAAPQGSGSSRTHPTAELHLPSPSQPLCRAHATCILLPFC